MITKVYKDGWYGTEGTGTSHRAHKQATPCDTVAVTVVCLAAVDVEVCGFVRRGDPDHFLGLPRL